MPHHELTIRLPAAMKSICLVGPGDAGTTCRTGAVIPADDERLRQMQAQLECECSSLGSARQALESATAKLGHLHEQVLAEAEEQLLDLAIQIARKVLMQEIQAQRYAIDPIVKEALLHVPARQDVVIHLNPDDFSRCEMASTADGSGSDTGGIRFVSDHSVRPAECVLETAQGMVESIVESHLESVREALAGPE